MTSLEKLCRANRWRIRPAVTGRESLIASTDAEGWNGHFLVPIEGNLWHVILSDRTGWRRLSVSNAQSKDLPSWTVMNRLKDAFFADNDWVVQFYPPRNVASAADCLELWQPLNNPLPLPIADGRDQTTGTDQRVHVETRPGGDPAPVHPNAPSSGPLTDR